MVIVMPPGAQRASPHIGLPGVPCPVATRRSGDLRNPRRPLPQEMRPAPPRHPGPGPLLYDDGPAGLFTDDRERLPVVGTKCPEADGLTPGSLLGQFLGRFEPRHRHQRPGDDRDIRSSPRRTAVRPDQEKKLAGIRRNIARPVAERLVFEEQHGVVFRTAGLSGGLWRPG